MFLIGIRKYVSIRVLFKLLIFCIVLGLVIWPLITHAQSVRRGIIISPAILESEADRGKGYDFTIKVTNDAENRDYQVETAIQTFAATGEEGIPAVVDFPKDADISSWVSFPERSFGLAQNQTKDFQVRLDVPESATPGDHYFAIAFTPQNKITNSTANVQIQERLVALLFVNVKGKISREAKIESITSNQQVYDPFFDSVKVKYRIKVTGNSYLKPSGNIFIGSDTAKPDNTLALNPEQKIVLPNTVRSFELQEDPAFQVPIISSALFWLPVNAQTNPNSSETDFKKPFAGNQKVETKILFVNSDGELSQTSANIQLLFIPWKSGSIALVVIMSLGLVWYRLRQIRNKRLKQ